MLFLAQPLAAAGGLKGFKNKPSQSPLARARSASETQIIGSADGARADPGIRSQVGSPTTEVVDKGLVTRDILFAPEGDGRDAQAAIPGA